MVKIVADSTCDLSEEIVEQYDIAIVPLHIVLDGKEYRDGEELHPDEIYQWVEDTGKMPKTSAAGMEDILDVLEPILEEENEAVVFCISETMSTTVNVFRMAVEGLGAEDRITVINSENVSAGIGHLVIEAAIMAKEGKSRIEILERIDELKLLVCSGFVVDTLSYLQKGGRCSSVSALTGGILNIHPKIVVKDGSLTASKKYRGKMSKVISEYLKDIEADLLSAKPDRVFLMHSGCIQENVDMVYEYLEGLNYFKEIIVIRAGGVISSHCGPGTMGVLFIKGEEKDV